MKKKNVDATCRIFYDHLKINEKKKCENMKFGKT